MSLILGIDIGGTGSRAALGEVDGAGGPAGRVDSGRHSEHGAFDAVSSPHIIDQLTGPRIEIGPGGSTVLQVVRHLVRSAAGTWIDRWTEVTGIGIGATGIASLADDPSAALAEISAEFGVPTVAAIDAVTAHLGALGGTGGAISVLGTGAIAIAHPGPDAAGAWSADWKRADGWGHLLGDRGGGAWLGRHGLELALRTHDGVDDHGRTLLEAATRRFGPPASWPGQFYTRGDRAGLLADFAVDIAGLSRAGDEAASGLLAEAGREAARSALAAASSSTDECESQGASPNPIDAGATLISTAQSAAAARPLRLALTGGLVQAGDALLDGFRTEAARLRAEVAVVESAGDPAAGAMILARLGAGGLLRAQDGVLWL